MKTLSLSLAVLMICAVPVFAGSTIAGHVHMPQGSAAGTANGDYVTANPGGINSVYRYFIEVPPSLGRLHVELYDADVGAGGSGEANTGLDRARGTGFNTTATYSLFDPSGASRPVSFTTGDAAGPGNAAWTSFFDSTGTGVTNPTVRDEFGSNSYANNDGTDNWSTDWVETDGGGGGATGGAIRVISGELRLQDNVSGTPNIYRQANLSAMGLTTATLTFDYRTSNNLENDDDIQVRISGNGGASYTLLENFSNDSSGSRSYDITSFIATNTRVQFLLDDGYGDSEFFYVDDVQITGNAPVLPLTAGHWELRISQAAGGDDINAIGIRAHDGNSGAGGTELNVYADSLISLGINPGGTGSSAASRTYQLHPWITSGCTASQNDFDRDVDNADSGNTGSVVFTSPGGAFTQTFLSATLSGDNAWNRDTFTGWTTGQDAQDYGVWTWAPTITTYNNNAGLNGNYETTYIGNSSADANPPSANPEPNTFRVYLPTDAGAAPLKPYLEQQVRHNRTFSGGSTVSTGVTSTFTVTVRIINPTAFPITFSGANLVTANVPGGIVLYGGNASVSQGSIVSQPTVGTAGNITWNPNSPTSLAAGSEAILAYDVRVTPVMASPTTIPVTGDAASGTRAQYVDETGNTTQARATYLLGGLCPLSVSRSFATPVLISSFHAESRGGATTVRWRTASEAGTIGFNIYRADGHRVNESLIPASLKPHGGAYEVLDTGNDAPAAGYFVEEVLSSGQTHSYGPLHEIHGLDREKARAGRDRRLQVVSAGISTEIDSSQATRQTMSAVMVGVASTGLVRVTAADLANALGTTEKDVAKSLAKGDVNVTSLGEKISWTTDGQSLIFFGEASTSIYSSERVYRVDLTGGGLRMQLLPMGASPAVVTSFTTSLEIESDVFASTVLPIDPEGDYWFWSYVLSGDATEGRRTFNVDVPAVASGGRGAVLSVRLQGALKDAAHGARVSLNGVPLGNATWTSFEARTTKFNLPAGALHDGTNEIAVEGILAPGSPFDVFYVDGFALQYQRMARPSGGQLEVGSSGRVTAGPFQALPMIVDISNRKRPSVITGAQLGPAGIVAVNVPGVKGGTLFFSESLSAPSSVRGVPASKLTAKKASADWVIIAPESMLASAESLAALRRSDGLSTYVAGLQQIYDEFAGGNVTPHAIRDFIRWTRTWSRSPRYYVLAGSGTMDYRGIEVSPGVMPPLMTSTPDGLYAADSMFTDFNGDGLPDAAIGRIPVSTSAELLAYVGKLASNRSKSVSTAPLIFTADAADGSASFSAASNLAEEPFASRPVTRVLLDQLGPAAARTTLLEAWRDGTPLVSWTGHGGLDQLSSSGLLTAYDAETLQSAGRLPVVVAMTCTINRFENGWVDPVGVTLTRQEDGGALAVWSASGLSNHADASAMQRTFMRLAAQSPGARVGDLVVASLNSHARDTSSTYLLLGDPAVKLDLPAELNPGGGSPPSGRE